MLVCKALELSKGEDWYEKKSDSRTFVNISFHVI